MSYLDNILYNADRDADLDAERKARKAYKEAPKFARFEDLVNQFRSLSPAPTTPPPTALDDQGLNYIGRPLEQDPVEQQEPQIPFRPLDQMEPDVIPEVSPGVPSDQELAMQQSQPKAPEIAPPQDEFSPTVDLQKNEPQQPVSRYEELLSRYKQMAEASADRMYNADKGDSDVGFMSAISKAGAKMNQALANRAGTTNIKVDAPELTSQYSKNLAGRLDLEQKQMTEEKNILKAMQDEATQKNVDDLNVLKVKEAKDSLDPNSDVSKAARTTLGDAYPELKNKYGDEWEKIPAASLSNIMSVLNLKENVAARRDIADANKLAKEAAADEKRQKEQEKKEEKRELIQVPGFKIQEGYSVTPKAAEDLRKAQATADNLFKSIDRIQDLMKKEGSAGFIGEDAAALQTEYKNMLMYAKEMYGLGVLQKIDADMINQIVPDPSSLEALSTTTSNVNKKYDSLKNALSEDYLSRMNSRGYKFDGKDIAVPTKKALQSVLKTEATSETYSPEIEAKIESSMKKNNASREQIINALKTAGKL